MPEAWHHRLKALLYFFLPGGRDTRQRAPVKRINGRENFKSPFIVAELPRELEQSFVRLRATVAEKHLSRRDEVHDGFGQTTLRLVIIEVGYMHQLARLLDERFGDGRRRVAQRGHSNAAAES